MTNIRHSWPNLCYTTLQPKSTPNIKKTCLSQQPISSTLRAVKSSSNIPNLQRKRFAFHTREKHSLNINKSQLHLLTKSRIPSSSPLWDSPNQSSVQISKRFRNPRNQRNLTSLLLPTVTVPTSSHSLSPPDPTSCFPHNNTLILIYSIYINTYSVPRCFISKVPHRVPQISYAQMLILTLH